MGEDRESRGKQKGISMRIKHAVFLGLVVISQSSIGAVDSTVKQFIPGSAQPGVINNTFAPAPPSYAVHPNLPARPEAPGNLLGTAAQKIKFKLTKIILEGNHVYSDQQLALLYQDKINKVITVQQLMDIVHSITIFYRDNGYILTRALIPPQHVANGIVRIRIVEGYISHVTVIGNPKGAQPLIQAYGDNIVHSRPLRLKDLERNLLLANSLPGVQVKAVLQPSKTESGASDLQLVAAVKTVGGYVSYDDYGTLYIGPHQLSVGANANSIMRPGDSISAAYSTSITNPYELHYKNVSYNTPLGNNGLLLNVSANLTTTHPGFVLTDEKIEGTGVTDTALLQYPLVLSRAFNLNTDASFNFINSKVTSFGFRVYDDQMRTIRVGGSYNAVDNYAGSNSLAAHLEKGFPIFGATTSTTTDTTSRYGGNADFLKADMQVSRLQEIGQSRYSALILLKGQYAFNPLLVNEQFAFGGSQLGRGYDPAEIIGDRGVGGTIEFRMNVSPDWRYLQSMQPYVFYDAGEIWNLRNVQDTAIKQSITSTGLGVRFSFNPYLSGNAMITQPLTKKVSAEEFIGRGKCPRGFFNLTLSG